MCTGMGRCEWECASVGVFTCECAGVVRSWQVWSGVFRCGWEWVGVVGSVQVWSGVGRCGREWTRVVMSEQQWAGVSRNVQVWVGACR